MPSDEPTETGADTESQPAAANRRIAGGQQCDRCNEVVSVIDNWCRHCGRQLRSATPDASGTYLAGPINHVRDHGRGWREYLIDEYPDLEWHNPLDINDDHEIEPSEAVPVWVVEADLEMVAEAGSVLAWLPFDTPSRGTAVEIFVAGADPGTDVIVWTDTAPETLSPFVRGPADEFVHSADEAVAAVRESQGVDDAE